MNKFEAFTTTLFEALAEDMKEFIEKRKTNTKKGDDENKIFYSGYATAYHRLFTLIEQQAEIYGVDLSEISMERYSTSDFI